MILDISASSTHCSGGEFAKIFHWNIFNFLNFSTVCWWTVWSSEFLGYFDLPSLKFQVAIIFGFTSRLWGNFLQRSSLPPEVWASWWTIWIRLKLPDKLSLWETLIESFSKNSHRRPPWYSQIAWAIECLMIIKIEQCSMNIVIFAQHRKFLLGTLESKLAHDHIVTFARLQSLKFLPS